MPGTRRSNASSSTQTLTPNRIGGLENVDSSHPVSLPEAIAAPTRWSILVGMSGESTASVAVTAHGLDDYRHMFVLDDGTLAHRRSLDCASGASAFGAELHARGSQTLSVDPLYGAGLDAVRERALHNLNHCGQWLVTYL